MSCILKYILHHLFTKWFKKYKVYKNLEDPYTFILKNDKEELIDGVIFGFSIFDPKESNCEFLPVGDQQKRYKNYFDLYADEDAPDNCTFTTYSRKKIMIGKIRLSFESKEKHFYQTNRIVYIEVDANGHQKELPWTPLNSKDCYQFQEDIIDITRFKKMILDTNRYITLKIAPKSKIVLIVFEIQEEFLNYFQYKKLLQAKEGKGKIIIQNSLRKMTFLNFIKRIFKLKK